MTDITRDPYGNPLHTRTREELIETIASVLFNYKTPASLRLWGRERSMHMAETIVSAITKEPRT